MAGELQPDQISDLNIRRRQIRERYDLGAAQQDYLSQTAANEAGRGQADLLDQYSQMRQRLPFAFAGRGLLNSGIYAKAVTDGANQLNRALTDNQGRLADQQAGFQLTKDQLGQVQAGGLSDVSEIEASRIASVAAALRASGAV